MGRNDSLGVIGTETMIGSGVTVTGKLASESDIFVDGNLSGDIKATGDVTIGINATISGNITGMTVKIAGEVTGNIHAEDGVTITETGQLRGNIAASGLTIIAGGIFNGANKVRQHDMPQEA